MPQIISTQYIRLGGLVFCFVSQLPLAVTENTRPFKAEPCRPDITIQVRIGEPMTSAPGKHLGRDMLIDYYFDGARYYAAARPGTLGPLMVTEYTPDFSEVNVFVNEREHPGIVRTVDKVLQFIPVRRYLLRNHRWILHASQIEVNGKGLLFSAPSGTGKSTQAALWMQHENARLICNDRTLLAAQDGGCFTYGYPVDGSSPVCANRRLELGALVILRQGSRNQIRRLSAFEGMKHLMDQTVLDTWDPDARFGVAQYWLDVLEKYPAYLLTCLPDAGAVALLKQELLREGVF